MVQQNHPLHLITLYYTVLGKMNNLIIEVIEKPGIRLDSIGVIILSSQGLQEFIES